MLSWLHWKVSELKTLMPVAYLLFSKRNYHTISLRTGSCEFFGVSDERAKKLQISGISILYALAKVDKVKDILSRLRTNEKLNEHWSKVKEQEIALDLLPATLPRV